MIKRLHLFKCRRLLFCHLLIISLFCGAKNNRRKKRYKDKNALKKRDYLHAMPEQTNLI